MFSFIAQIDEEEMGISYQNLDIVLNNIAKMENDETSILMGVSEKKILEIRTQVKAMEHKRRPALCPDVGLNV